MLLKKLKVSDGIWFIRKPIITREMTICRFYGCSHLDSDNDGYNSCDLVCNACSWIRDRIITWIEHCKHTPGDLYYYMPLEDYDEKETN